MIVKVKDEKDKIIKDMALPESYLFYLLDKISKEHNAKELKISVCCENKHQTEAVITLLKKSEQT